MSEELDLGGLVEYIARALVRDQEAISVVEENTRNGGTIVRLHVAPGDMGHVIGKDGRIANAIRTLLRVGGTQTHRRITLDID